MHLAAHMPDASEQLRPRLLEQVRNALRRKHYSLRTEEVYIDWARRFVRFSGLRHPRDCGVADVEAFLTHLATQGRVSASTQNQAKSALPFCTRKCFGVSCHGSKTWIRPAPVAATGRAE